jgi:hypothetical protein
MVFGQQLADMLGSLCEPILQIVRIRSLMAQRPGDFPEHPTATCHNASGPRRAMTNTIPNTKRRSAEQSA